MPFDGTTLAAVMPVVPHVAVYIVLIIMSQHLPSIASLSGLERLCIAELAFEYLLLLMFHVHSLHLKCANAAGQRPEHVFAVVGLQLDVVKRDWRHWTRL